ncbi:cytochrome P450 [Paenibacillus sp. B01]|nr:cytochrome P450 [Paenibacillus sp. B01]
MYEAPASLGLAYVKGRRSRRQGEKRFAALIEDVREGRLDAREGSALRTIALHRDLQGQPLPARIAAVELLNILRPIVAVAVYVAFTAHAVIHHPEEAARLAREEEERQGQEPESIAEVGGPRGLAAESMPDHGGPRGSAAESMPGKREERLQRFVQEVRRFYPFFPVAAARAGEPAEWAGFQLEAGQLVMLDLYATNRHPALWSDPESFQPERFAGWQGSPFKFVPQGGGGHDAGHRCAGEWITLEIMKESLDFLANRLAYELPEQDLSFSLGDIPSLPHSRVRLRSVRLER